MELHMKRCNGMSAVRAKAEEFSKVREVSHDVDELGHRQLPTLDIPQPLSTSVPSSDSPVQV